MMRREAAALPGTGHLVAATTILTIGAVGAVLAVGVPVSHWLSTTGVLMISVAFCAAVSWRRLGSLADAVLPDFLTIYLLAQFAGKLFTLAGVVIFNNIDTTGTLGDLVFGRSGVANEFQFRAEVILLAGTVIFTWVWERLERGRPLTVRGELGAGMLWMTYVASTVLYFGMATLSPQVSFGMLQTLAKSGAIGSIAVLLGGRSRFAFGKRGSVWPILALLPMMKLAVESGSKGEIALAAMPLVFPLLRGLTPRRALGLATVALLFMFVVLPFSQAWRVANWAAWQGHESAGILDVAGRVVTDVQEFGLSEFSATNVVQLVFRASSAEQGGLVVSLAESEGFLGPELLDGLLAIFVPRIFWPDKPVYTPGSWFTWYLGLAPSPEEATTSTAMLLPTEFYWMFGYAGVVIGSILLALVYFGCMRALLALGRKDPVALMTAFSLLLMAPTMEASHTIYAVSAPVILVIFAALAHVAQAVLRRILIGPPQSHPVMGR